MVICLLPAMNVVFQFADLAMSMKEEKEAKIVLSVKLDIRDSKVKLEQRTVQCNAIRITSFNFSFLFFLNTHFLGIVKGVQGLREMTMKKTLMTLNMSSTLMMRGTTIVIWQKLCSMAR